MPGDDEKIMIFKALQRRLEEMRKRSRHALDHPTDPMGAAEALAAIEKTAAHCADLLTYLFSEFPDLIRLNSTVSLRVLLSESVESFRKARGDEGVQISQEIFAEPKVRADHEMLAGALRTFLTAALRSSDDTARITLQLDKENDRALITITGPGVQAGRWTLELRTHSKRDLISGKTADPGIIGLLGAIKVLELHGASLAAGGEGDETIVITIPSIETEAALPEAEKQAAEREKPLPDDFAVLIADDDGSIRELLKTIIRSIGVARIDGARDGEEALRLARENDYRAVFMDISMPGTSGVEIGRQIIAMKPRTKIIFITGLYQEEETIARLLREDAYAYIRKPFNITAIKQLILDLSPPTR